MNTKRAGALLAVMGLLGSSAAVACATCGCSLSSEAATGYSATAGWRFSLQYDYIDQSQLRHGTHAISAAEVAALNPGANQEVEHDTTSRYTTLGLHYAPNPDWDFNLLVPYVDRTHSTYGAATPNQLTSDQLSHASVSSLGDVKFVTNFQGLLPTHNLGIQLGVKLPTGNYGGPNAAGTGTVGRGPVRFSSGPAAGQLLDTSLQAGTGSTDVILGAYYYQAVSQDFDAFVNGQYQRAVREALDQPGADFRPGDLATVSFGLRYEENPNFVPQVQVNLTRKLTDTGALGDTISTGGTVAYLSPGFTVGVQENLQLYGFVQVPVYSKLDGYQLFPRWTATGGISYAM